MLFLAVLLLFESQCFCFEPSSLISQRFNFLVFLYGHHFFSHCFFHLSELILNMFHMATVCIKENLFVLDLFIFIKFVD